MFYAMPTRKRISKMKEVRTVRVGTKALGTREELENRRHSEKG